MRDKYAVWKWLILVAAVAFSLVAVTPPGEKVRKGIDLAGGVSITVEMDVDEIRRGLREELPDASESLIEDRVNEALRGAQDRTLEVIRNRVDSLGTREPVIYPTKGNRVVVQLPEANAKDIADAEEQIRRAAFLQFRIVHKDNARLVRNLVDKRLVPEGYRLDAGGSQYVLDEEFPASKRTEEYRERLSRFATPDPSYQFMLEKTENDKRVTYVPYFVKRRPELTGEYLEDASVDVGPMGEPLVQLRFNAKGSKKFAAVTGDYAPGGARNPNPNEHCQLAIVLDDTLYSAPRINEAIFGGRAQIEGRFSTQEAQLLSNVLRAGSLPAPLKVVEKRFVAPTLGSDAIAGGVKAIVYTLIGVALFMLFYYRLSGLIADIALALNLILMPLGMILTAGCLSIFARDGGSSGGHIQLPVLTLPGIAGIVLTIGMAVDSNILLSERKREEQASGKRLSNVISAGYARAFAAIFDSHVATIISGIALFVFGSGPIRGFAVTLIAGLIINLFTSLTVTRLLFDAVASRTKMETLKMANWVKKTSIDFVGLQKYMIGASIVIGIVTWALMIGRGVHNPSSIFAVDFTGGAAVTFTFKQEQPIETIRAKLDAAGVKDAPIQYQRETQVGPYTYLQVRTAATPINGRSPVDIVKEVLAKDLPEGGFVVAQEDTVGAQVGGELAKKAVWALVFSLVGIIVYIGFRFEFGFGFGAILSLVHDVIITAGLYTLLGRQINLTVVAALLTIIGYSVNDTIVIFDRVREDLRLVPNKTFKEICNQAINETLGRTLLTTFTVFISVLVLLLVGTGDVRDFAITMLIGLISGTYSTVYVATPLVLAWYRGRRPDFGTKKA